MATGVHKVATGYQPVQKAVHFLMKNRPPKKRSTFSNPPPKKRSTFGFFAKRGGGKPGHFAIFCKAGGGKPGHFAILCKAGGGSVCKNPKNGPLFWGRFFAQITRFAGGGVHPVATRLPLLTFFVI